MFSIIPSWYPNRAVRRAVKQGRMSRLPAAWASFLTLRPELVIYIKKGTV